MKRLIPTAVLLVVGSAAVAAEKSFDFSSQLEGQLPTGFRSALNGEGAMGDWQVKEIPLESVETATGPASSVSAREAVVAQSSRDPTDERFPLLIYEGDTYGDFTFSAKVRAVEGAVEQMAGLLFRLRDETNYYALRLSALGSNVRFYKVVDGVRSPPIGVALPVARGEWRELRVACEANQIRCWIDDRELFPTLTDNSFAQGRIGLWTKSDSVSYFKDLRVIYRPREVLAQRLVREAMASHGRLLGLELYASPAGSDEVSLVAGGAVERLGQAGGKAETEVARQGRVYYGQEKGAVSVLLPLRDRNGDPVGAVRVRMKRFPGQTQQNAFVRAQPIVDRMSEQVRSRADLFQ